MGKAFGWLALVVPLALHAEAPLPAWWQALLKRPRLEARFAQRMESAVFGKITREGKVWIGSGGRLRFAYDSGLLIVCDGRLLIQYDPDTRTAQQMALAQAQREFPLLGLLSNPAGLGAHYRIQAQDAGQVRLEPKNREQGGVILLSGKEGQLRRIQWQDPSGAAQDLELIEQKIPTQDPSPELFRFKAPTGTHWAGA